jgi:DnaK suppressor protein
MLDEQRAQPAAPAAVPAAGRGGPRGRALLEDRWQTRLREVTELSLAYHQATDVIPHGQDAGEGGPEAQQLLDRTVAARRQLADTEEALGRLTAGTFGRCEQCGSALPPALLAVTPEARYCPSCAAGPAAPINPRRARTPDGRQLPGTNSRSRGAANSLVTTSCGTAGSAMICVVVLVGSFRGLDHPVRVSLAVRSWNLVVMQPRCGQGGAPGVDALAGCACIRSPRGQHRAFTGGRSAGA